VDQFDVRWDGVTHNDIDRWVKEGVGPAATERLEAKLTEAAEALAKTADLANGILRKVDGGEWTGNAATVAAAAIQVLRDFDDIMGHHGKVNTLAAYGQSDNAAWAKSNVPPFVDARAPQIPTGTPNDILTSTVDYHDQLRAAKDAEERARQVMRAYQDMTADRIANLPPLSPAPRVVVTGAEDTITVGPGSSDDRILPRGGGPDDGDPGAAPRPGTGPAQEAAPLPGPPVDTVHPGNGPSTTTPAAVEKVQPPPPSTPAVGEPARPAPGQTAGFAAVADKPGPGGDRGGGRPVGPGPRAGNPRGAPGRGGGFGGEGHARTGTRVIEAAGRSAGRGGPAGLAPVGTAVPTSPDEDNEHKSRYAILGAEIFEPDNDDGLLHDPFRPGSFVAPSSIGDDDDE
jgi:hypothetical protein